MAQYLHHLEVSGEGVFPLDMLRRDSCWPASSHDVDAIHASVVRDERAYRVRVLQRNSSKLHHFTLDRWRSFGAVVLAVGTTPLK